MPRRATRARPEWRRLFGERPWWVVALVLAVALLVGWQATMQALLLTARKSNPPIALRLDDPSTKLRLQLQQGMSDPSKLDDPQIVREAHEALKKGPLDTVALRALAVYYNATQKQDKFEALANLAGQTSRRDRQTQILLAGAAAQAGDAKRTMDHLNTALTTASGSQSQIFAAMSPLARQERFREMLLPYVRDDVMWIEGFLRHLLGEAPESARASAEIILRADPKQTVELRKELGGDLLGMLATFGEFELLRRSYALVRGTGPDLSQTASFEAATLNKDLGWLGWTPSENASLGTDLDRKDDQITATVYAGQGERGVALHRTLFLRPGVYSLDERRKLTFGGDGAKAQWSLYCAEGGGARRQIWSGPSRLIYTTRAAAGPVIPAGCSAQVLELAVDGGVSTRGFEFLIDRFALVPAS